MTLLDRTQTDVYGRVMTKFQLRCSDDELGLWRQAAGKQPLASWVRDSLNQTAVWTERNKRIDGTKLLGGVKELIEEEGLGAGSVGVPASSPDPAPSLEEIFKGPDPKPGKRSS